MIIIKLTNGYTIQYCGNVELEYGSIIPHMITIKSEYYRLSGFDIVWAVNGTDVLDPDSIISIRGE